MGNPNRRVVAAKPVTPTKPVQEPVAQPLPSAPAAKCEGHCGVRNHYEKEKTWNTTDADLPKIVQVKQNALNDALKDHKLMAAQNNREWLEIFYSWHGPHDGSALGLLPKIPDACQNAACPVRAYHHDKVFAPGAEDLPSIIRITTQTLNFAISKGDYERAVGSWKLLAAFWTIHGPEDGSALAGLPHIPKVW
ncbi:MAG: hypothetical protein Q9226_006999 [Calogaya cf. arnoldii]